MGNRVMIVDDEPSILIAVRELLKMEGYDVITAQGGEKCLEELKKGFKGVILMDIMMPAMDGWDTIEHMVNEGLIEGNVVSMLTAKDVPDAKMDYLKEYVIDYITKPFDPEQLVSIVGEYLAYS